MTLPGSGIRTVTLTATLTRGEATAYRSFDIRVWSQAELDKEAAKSELQKLVERLDGTVILTPEYGQDTNVTTMLRAKLDDSSVAVSVSKVEEVYGGAGIAADGTITYFFVDPNTTPLVHNGSYNVTFALSKAGATETLQVPVGIGWDVQRVRDAISAEITSRLTTEGLCAAGDDPNLLTQDLTLPKVIDGKLAIDPIKCNHCGRCVTKCPFQAVENSTCGYKVTIGGRWGKKIAEGKPLSRIFTSEEEVLDLVEKTILFYRDEGITGERFADTIARLGFDYVENKLLEGTVDKEKVLGKEVEGGATC